MFNVSFLDFRKVIHLDCCGGCYRYVPLQSCITLIPENGFGGQVPEWPARLSSASRRLGSVAMDAGVARSQVIRADQRYWHAVVESYLRGLGLHKDQFRNIMDMRAMYGGYATITDLLASDPTHDHWNCVKFQHNF